MLLAFRSFSWAMALVLLNGAPALAQSKSQVADSLKKVIADHRLRLHVADSIGDSHVAVDLRLRLARMVKPKEALSLLQDASTIADTMGLLEDEMVARRILTELHERSGNLHAAYAEAMRIVELDNERLAAQEEVAGANADIGLANAAAELDSVQNKWRMELTASNAEVRAAEERGNRWMLIAVAIGVLFLVTLLVVVYRSGRSNQRIRTELASLRAEITTLKEQRPKNEARLTPPSAVPRTEPVVVPLPSPVPEPTPIAAFDPLVLAMFQKMAPERLATLRDARARGDHAKVTRVVHSLKPQLVNFDEAHFAELCARITAPDAPANEVRWSADLDALEKSVSAVLARIGH